MDPEETEWIFEKTVRLKASQMLEAPNSQEEGGSPANGEGGSHASGGDSSQANGGGGSQGRPEDGPQATSTEGPYGQSLSAVDLAAANGPDGAAQSHKSFNSNKDLSGTILGQKFELLAFVGRGGMSEVYKARHVITGKTVAVKIMHQKLARDETTIRRLKQEAQAAGALTHPNILGVHDFGIDSSGTPFLVMDFIDGVSLSDLLRKDGPLTLDRFLSIMQQVASALAHAQEQNVVHRDLKPSNIMIVNSGGKETAKIVDFGIAKLVDQDEDGAQQRLTQTGELFGSPLYMSPEQCTGAPVDPRSDIYAFGCVLYESLSGKPPHIGDTVYDTIHRHINGLPDPLMAPQIDEATKGRLEGIVLKCLAKAPTDRYQNASDIESELRKISLSGSGGLIGRLGSAWQLNQAKNAARKKSTVPLLVISLFTVSALSIIASAVLVFNLIEFGNCNQRLTKTNLILSYYAQSFNDMAAIYRLSQHYIMSPKPDPTIVPEMQRFRKSVLLDFARIAPLMKDNPQKLARFQARRKTIETSIDGFFEELKTIPAASDTSDGGLGMFRNFPSIQRLAYRAQREQLNFTTLQHEENKELRKEAIRVDKAQFNVNVAGFLSILLNSSVVITMIIYFIRNKRLQRLAEAKLANKPKEGIPETGEGLENLLHELAGALSEAEHREKMLLSKLQTQSGQEAVLIKTSSEAELQAAKADDMKQVITERASISNNKDIE